MRKLAYVLAALSATPVFAGDRKNGGADVPASNIQVEYRSEAGHVRGTRTVYFMKAPIRARGAISGSFFEGEAQFRDGNNLFLAVYDGNEVINKLNPEGSGVVRRPNRMTVYCDEGKTEVEAQFPDGWKVTGRKDCTSADLDKAENKAIELLANALPKKQ